MQLFFKNALLGWRKPRDVSTPNFKNYIFCEKLPYRHNLIYHSNQQIKLILIMYFVFVFPLTKNYREFSRSGIFRERAHAKRPSWDT